MWYVFLYALMPVGTHMNMVVWMSVEVNRLCLVLFLIASHLMKASSVTWAWDMLICLVSLVNFPGNSLCVSLSQALALQVGCQACLVFICMLVIQKVLLIFACPSEPPTSSLFPRLWFLFHSWGRPSSTLPLGSPGFKSSFHHCTRIWHGDPVAKLLVTKFPLLEFVWPEHQAGCRSELWKQYWMWKKILSSVPTIYNLCNHQLFSYWSKCEGFGPCGRNAGLPISLQTVCTIVVLLVWKWFHAHSSWPLLRTTNQSGKVTAAKFLNVTKQLVFEQPLRVIIKNNKRAQFVSYEKPNRFLECSLWLNLLFKIRKYISVPCHQAKLAL